MINRYHLLHSKLCASIIVVILTLCFSDTKAQLVTGVDTLQILSGQWEYYDFTASTSFTIADTATYTPDIWGSSNEGVNFGKEFSPLIPARRILLLGTGDIDTVTTVPTWTDAAPWVDTSWDWPNGTQGQPISPGQLWVVYTSEGLYVVMQIDELPNGNFGDSFTFKFKYMSEGGTTLEESNLNEETGSEQISGTSTSTNGTGFDFSREETGDNNDAGEYHLDFAFVNNEGVNFGNEGSTSLANTGRRFILLGSGSLDTLTTIPERVDAAPWVTVSYDFSDGTGGLPIAVGQLWGVFTREGNYAAMEITALPGGNFGSSFDFNYKYQPNGTRFFSPDTTGNGTVAYQINIESGNEQTVLPGELSGDSLKVSILKNSVPAQNEAITFEVTSQPSGVMMSASVNANSITDTGGLAQSFFRGGDVEGSYIIKASVDSDPSAFVEFTITVADTTPALGELSGQGILLSTFQGFDFSKQVRADNEDGFEYEVDLGFVNNEGVNFGNEGSSSLSGTGRRFILLGTGTIDTVTSVPERVDAAPWVTVSYDFSDGTGGLPIAVGQLWGVYTREGHYAVMQITALPEGGFGSSFEFDYKYQPNGNRTFEADTSITVEPDPIYSISIANGDSQRVAPTEFASSLLQVLVTDENEDPVNNQQVEFEFTLSPTGTTVDGIVSQFVTTDTSGIAGTQVSGGDAVGEYQIQASLLSDSTKFVLFTLFVEAQDTTSGEIISGSSTGVNGRGFDFSREEIGTNVDTDDYILDFAFVANEGVNFGNEGSTSLTETGRRFLLLGEGLLDTLSSVPERLDASPWVTVTYDFADGTGGQPISVGQLWAVYTREGHYAVMEITELPEGNFGNSFTFDYKYQPNGSRFFDGDTSIVVEPDPELSISIAQGDSQIVAPTLNPDEFLEVLVTDKNISPVEGEAVKFEITEQPLSVSISASVTQQTYTDTAGIAWALFTAGDASGIYKVQATLVSDTSKFVQFSLFVNEEDTAADQTVTGTNITSTTGTGFDFSLNEVSSDEDFGNYQLDFAFVSNEGVNFGNEGSTSLANTGRRFLLLGEGSLDTLTSVPLRADEAPWVTVSYDFQHGTLGLPISVGQLWAVYTREGNYAAMEIIELPDGDFGNSFTFNYKYQLNGSRFFENDSTSVSIEDEIGLPMEIGLSQNYPNPFNPATNIEYSLNVDSNVLLEVFDIQGRLVRTLVNQKQTSGMYNVTFDAQNLSTGVYIYRLNVGANTFTKKMLLIK